MTSDSTVGTPRSTGVDNNGMVNSAVSAVREFFYKLPDAIATRDGLQHTVKLIAYSAIPFFGKGHPIVLQQKVAEVDSMIDALGMPQDVVTVLKGELSKNIEEKKYNKLMGNICMIGANLGGTLLILSEFLGHLVVNQTSKVAALAMKLGKLNVFGVRPFHIVFGNTLLGFTMRMAAFGYIFLAANAYEEIESGAGNRKTKWELAHYVAEVAVKSIFFLGYSSPIFIGVAGVSAALTGLVKMSFTPPRPAVAPVNNDTNERKRA